MKEYGISYIYQAFYKKGKSPGRVHHYFGESIMHVILPHSFSSKKKKKDNNSNKGIPVLWWVFYI